MHIIAYYLPQYYPFKENNEWWGEGFTEWTNVGKAKPLFRHHDQPKVPSSLGYYDLRLDEVKEKQIKLAKEAGVTAFCYWHYWFGNGRMLLDLPLKQVIKNQELDFPICLGWANETWMAKVWNHDGSFSGKNLIEQLYPGDNDIIEHFNKILCVIRDKRYLKIDNRPVFVIYKPLQHPCLHHFMHIWNDLIKESGVGDSFFFIGHTVNVEEIDNIKSLGVDAVNIVRIGEYRYNKNVISKIPFKLFAFKFLHRPLVLRYSFISKYFINENIDKNEDIIPTLIPNWDHTPRSGKRGVVFHKSNGSDFEKHAIRALNVIKGKCPSRQILFLKSWNEWGEGNYMEPDLNNGKAFIKALKSAIDKVFK